MDERIERTVATYEDVADEYQSLHCDRSNVAPIIEEFRERVTEVASTDATPRVVDVGCGPGWEMATLADCGFEVFGVDITPAFLAAARERAPAATYLRGDMRRLPIGTSAVDGLLTLASLLHVPKRSVGDALSEFARVVAPGGVVTIVMKLTDRDSEGSPYGDADRRHFEFYDPGPLRERIERAGFTVDSSTVEDGWIVVHAHGE